MSNSEKEQVDGNDLEQQVLTRRHLDDLLRRGRSSARHKKTNRTLTGKELEKKGVSLPKESI